MTVKLKNKDGHLKRCHYLLPVFVVSVSPWGPSTDVLSLNVASFDRRYSFREWATAVFSVDSKGSGSLIFIAPGLQALESVTRLLPQVRYFPPYEM